MRQNALLIGVVMLLIGSLAACGRSSKGANTPSPPTPTYDTAAQDDILRLQTQYEMLRTAQGRITEMWESLANGETIRCGEYSLVPAPEDIHGETQPDIVELLQDASVAVGQAVDLLEAECQNPRVTIPPDIIAQGINMSRVAERQLDLAAALLPQTLETP